MTDECAYPDCDDPVYGKREWCLKHYWRVLRHGDPSRGHLVGTSYKACHKRLESAHGKATTHDCANEWCERRARYWALDWLSDPEHLRLDYTGYPYSTDTDAYTPLCPRCHHLLDRSIRKALDQIKALLDNEPLTEREATIADLLIKSDSAAP